MEKEEEQKGNEEEKEETDGQTDRQEQTSTQESRQPGAHTPTFLLVKPDHVMRNAATITATKEAANRNS